MNFWLFNSTLVGIIFFLLIILSFVWPPDSPWAPWWRTNKKVARAMCCLAKVSKKDIIYDLGCGDGTALIVAAKEFGAKGVGVEIDPLRFLISTLMTYIIKVRDKVTIKRKNFFDVDISEASAIFVYLVPKTLERLRPKFQKELKKGTRIVSLKYKINLPLKKQDKQFQLFLYEM